VNKLLAIVFSLALVSAQLIAFADTAPVTAQKVTTCDCGMAKCCVAKSSDASKEAAPAVPAQSSSQKSFQIGLTLAAWSLTPQIVCDDLLISSRAAPMAVQSVPLFTRDCSYLL